MAIIDLGTKSLQVGEARRFYTPFSVDIRRVYLIYAEVAVTNPNNVFSVFSLYPLFTRDDRQIFFLPQNPIIQIEEGIQTFYLPLSPLYAENGFVTIGASRIPRVRDSADADSGATLKLFYDDEEDIRTWLA